MTSPLQQKLKVTGPVVVTANRLGDGAVVYRSVDGTWTTELAAATVVTTTPAASDLLTAALADKAQGGRCLCRAGGIDPGTGRAAGQSARGGSVATARPSHFRASAEGSSCTFTTTSTARLSRNRVREFRDQVARRLSGRIDGRRVQAVAAHERRLSAAARLYAADRHSLWHALLRAIAHACACGAPLRPQLRSFHHAPEHSVQLDQARRIARCDGRSGARRHARHADQRQLRAQYHDPTNGRASHRARSRIRGYGRSCCAST